MYPLIEWVTGARRGEISKTLYGFLGLFFLLLSYYLVKPLRMSFFLKEFHPDLLPQFTLWVTFFSIVITKTFNSFYHKTTLFKLIACTYFLVIACKVGLHFGLLQGGKWVSGVFYIWASVYFYLCITILWACISYIFTPEQGERCYGFISIGAMAGAYVGADLSNYLADTPLKNSALLVSGAVLSLVILILAKALQQAPEKKPVQTGPLSLERPKSDFFSDIRILFQNKYVRSIAIMVYALAVFNMILDFQSQKVIDQSFAKTQYGQSFSDLNVPPQVGLDFVYGLKQLPKEARPQAVQNFIDRHKLTPTSAQFLATYQKFKDAHEKQVRKFTSQIYKYQNILGIFLLFFAARFIFQKLGLRFALFILPIFYLGVMAALMFPIGLMVVQGFLVVGYGLSYSLNKTARELLYTRTDKEILFRVKPLIHGPIVRIGDVSASLLKLGVFGLVLGVFHWKGLVADQILVALSFPVLIYWAYAMWFVGGEYDRLKKEEG